MTFRAGQSGNPAGRPKGVGRVAEYRQQLQSRASEIIDAVIASALAGEAVAQRLVIERLVPAIRPESRPISFEVSENATLPQLGDSIIRAVASGQLPADTAARLLQALASQSKLIETEQLEARIAALEAASGKSSAAA